MEKNNKAHVIQIKQEMVPVLVHKTEKKVRILRKNRTNPVVRTPKILIMEVQAMSLKRETRNEQWSRQIVVRLQG